MLIKTILHGKMVMQLCTSTYCKKTHILLKSRKSKMDFRIRVATNAIKKNCYLNSLNSVRKEYSNRADYKFWVLHRNNTFWGLMNKINKNGFLQIRKGIIFEKKLFFKTSKSFNEMAFPFTNFLYSMDLSYLFLGLKSGG